MQSETPHVVSYRVRVAGGGCWVRFTLISPGLAWITPAGEENLNGSRTQSMRGFFYFLRLDPVGLAWIDFDGV